MLSFQSGVSIKKKNRTGVIRTLVWCTASLKWSEIDQERSQVWKLNVVLVCVWLHLKDLHNHMYLKIIQILLASRECTT